MTVFGWIAERSEPPPRWDLRRAGWTLSADAPVRLTLSTGAAARRIVDPVRCLFVGVDSGAERARLLDAGCGDAVPSTIELPELARRATRIAERGDSLPRRREIGPLSLDLLHRDASTDGRWLSLHPREFAVLWRLAESPGVPVARAALLRDVWRLDIEPGTNSVQVHVSRLRAKLAGAGIDGLLETDPRGGYRLCDRTPRARSARPFARRHCAQPNPC